ncbi:hypothetical protein VNO78_04014 [Psophocarpus tetragonolobus]|uniref:Uncharacterized protein n=1 Tax=Psophocarpus tetragonolobus TaxID=3891 RepID=A0AAN9TFH2_PSOTE
MYFINQMKPRVFKCMCPTTQLPPYLCFAIITILKISPLSLISWRLQLPQKEALMEGSGNGYNLWGGH